MHNYGISDEHTFDDNCKCDGGNDDDNSSEGSSSGSSHNNNNNDTTHLSQNGYHGTALEILNNNNNEKTILVGDTITIISKNATHTGILMPRYEYDDDKHVVIKLKSGYNVGINTDTIESVKIVSQQQSQPQSQQQQHSKDPTTIVSAISDHKNNISTSYKKSNNKAEKRILLLSTGGTIASRIDYRTGAVTPVLSADDLHKAVPELGGIAAIDTKVILSEYSENVTPEHWQHIAKEIVNCTKYDYTSNGDDGGGGDDDKRNETPHYDGIIIAHGTDTIHYTSAFLSFALAKFPIPIVLVGAQRSSDRASSDAATNLLGAARFITSQKGKNAVYVAMHKETSDDTIACHIGTRVRKMHTSKRDAFETIGAEPAYVVSADGNVTTIITDSNVATTITDSTTDEKDTQKYTPKINLDQKVALVKYYPGYDKNIIEHMIDSKYKAIIFEGTGLGHVGKTLYEQVRRAANSGIFLGMTSQCIQGRVRMTVYESGRDLMNMGVVPLYDMLPEVALVKAMWAAGHADNASEIKEIMLQNIASEVSVL